jgi:hypothetical protein
MSRIFGRLCYAVVLAVTLSPVMGLAQSIFWKTSVKTGSYSDTNNWTGGVVPSPPAIAYFGTGTNSYNVTLDVSTNVGGIRVEDGAYVTLTIAAGQTYTLGSGGVYLRGSALYHPANPVPGKPGPVLHVAGGTFTNSGGALIGDSPSKYGTLVLDGGIGFFQALTISTLGAYGHLRVINKSTFVSQAADVRHAGLILLDGTSTWSQIANNSFIGSQGGHDASLVITNGSFYKIVGGGMYIAGDIVTGTGRVYVAGSGSSYSGRVAVSEYNLYSKGVGFFTVGDGAVVYGDKFNVQKPGTFTLAGGKLVFVGGYTKDDPYCSFGLMQGTGTIEHTNGVNVTFGNGGTMSPGLSSIGTITFATNVNFNNYAYHARSNTTYYGTMLLDVDGKADGQYDKIMVLGGRTATFNGGTNIVTMLNAKSGKYAIGDVFDLVIANTVTLTAAPTLVFSANTYDYANFAGTLTKATSGGILQTGQQSVRLTLTQAPRPMGTLILVR